MTGAPTVQEMDWIAVAADEGQVIIAQSDDLGGASIEG